MTTRKDIQPNAKGFRRLSYTCRCGWIDWGHALPGGPGKLKAQLDAERALDWAILDRITVTLNGQPAFIVHYGQSMGAWPFQVGNARHWIVRKGLNAAEREQVGLAVFMAASMNFEALQGTFPFSIAAGGSSFSPEDLLSNLIGFYMAFRGVAGQAAMRSLCGEVSVAESYKVWDDHLPDGLSRLKNPRAQPILFPCTACRGRNTSFPSQFATLVTAPPGRLYVKPRRRFVPSGAGAPLDFDASGVMRPSLTAAVAR